MDDQLSVLIEEYKEMRTEIRSSYNLYFSILFGVILTGVAAAYVFAFQNPWVFLWIPFLICSWMCIVTYIRCNIQHISTYISNLEDKINVLCSTKHLYYESEHAAKLWFSRMFLTLGALTIAPLLVCYGISVYKGSIYLMEKKTEIFYHNDVQWLFVLLSVLAILISVALLIKLPRWVRDKKI